MTQNPRQKQQELTPQQQDKEYYTSRKKKAQRIYQELTQAGLQADKKLRVLEVGCNHGFIIYTLSKLTKWDCYAGDLNTEHLYRYPEIANLVTITKLDATKMKYKNNYFDLVIYNHVIEHIPSWEKTIQEIYRVLKPQGTLYLATPNRYRLLTKPKMFLTARKKKLNKQKRIDLHIGFSTKEINDLLKEFSQQRNLNKTHTTQNIPKPLKPLGKIIPEIFYKKHSQTTVVIATK